MSYRRPRAETFTLDGLTAIMVALVVVIQTGAVAMAVRLQRQLQLPADASVTSPEVGIWLLGVVVAESIGIVIAWRVWQRLPSWVQTAIKYAVGLAFFGGLFYMVVLAFGLKTAITTAAAGALWIGLYKLLVWLSMDWLPFNATAVLCGMTFVAVAAQVLTPPVVAVLLVAAIVWDHVAVNLSSIMSELVSWSSASGIPNYIILPSAWQIDTDDVDDYITSAGECEKPAGCAGVIGVGDFGLPALLTASAWLSGAEGAALLAGCGTLAAMIVLRDAMEHADGGLPALPWLNTGALVGFAVGIAANSMALLPSLGVM